MNQLSAQQIVGGFNRRESVACDWVYREYYPDVQSLVRKLIGTHADVDDLVSESFKTLLEFTGRIERLYNIKRFLFITARNKCVKWLKHKEVEVSRMKVPDEYDPFSEAYSADDWDMQEELITKVYRALDQLSNQQRQIILMYYRDGVRHEDIAAQLGISVKTVANTRTMSINRLREILNIKRDILIILIALLCKQL